MVRVHQWNEGLQQSRDFLTVRDRRGPWWVARAAASLVVSWTVQPTRGPRSPRSQHRAGPITHRAVSWATDRICAIEGTVASIARGFGVSWPTVWSAVELAGNERVDGPDRMGESPMAGRGSA